MRGRKAANKRDRVQKACADGLPIEQQLPEPNYTIAETEQNGLLGWKITLLDVRRVRYRVVSGYEQCVEPASDSLYLCVAAAGYANVGFKFACQQPRVFHSREGGSYVISLFVIK
ncbi:hypothetical protein PAPHI01_0264 [Pancytospora philotis]|nr:hypothetical protein PAPHI01_0264 [Pancytospora philotis]